MGELAQGRRPIAAAAILAVGAFLGALAIGQGLRHLRTGDRYVTVKGVAEQEVEADLALWPIRFTAADDDLATAQKRIQESHAEVLAFLSRHGVDADRVRVQGIEVTDVNANPYRSGPVTTRYIIQQALMVRSADPGVVEWASQEVGELVARGVVLGAQQGPESGPTYLFTRLTALKPGMVAGATADARAAAEQFAADSGSRVGAIRHASQGVFQILARDPAPGISESSQRHKTVRVVSTVEYFLED